MVKKKFGRYLLFLLSLLFVFSAGLVLTCCNNKVSDNDLLKLEAEKAVVQGTPAKGSRLFTVSANSKSDNITSNSKYVSNLATAGNNITWIFCATASGTTDLYLSVANGVADSGSFKAGGGKIFSLKVNGTDVSVPETEISAATQYCDKWQSIKIADVNLISGYNKIVCEITDVTAAVNIDYLGINKVKTEVSEAAIKWVNKTIPATCTANGEIYRTFTDGDFTFSYLYGTIAATGHEYGDWHYDSESGKMVKECIHCGDKIYADVPSTYFGEVYNDKTYTVRATETVFEAELAKIDYSVGGLNNGTSPIENNDKASGGKLVGNISNLGNYIEFKFDSTKVCKADLVLSVANVKWTNEGIGVLDPMSNYVSFAINGEEVDFSFVALPGNENYDYYCWKYVVMKDINLKEGSNILKFSPKDNEDSITIPNTDILCIYTDEDCISITRSYDINNAKADNSFASKYSNVYNFSLNTGNYSYKSGNKSNCDLVVTVNADESTTNLCNLLTLIYNSNSVNLENIALEAGTNKVIIPLTEIKSGDNVLLFTVKSGIKITSVAVYCETEIKAMIGAVTDAAYDAKTSDGSKTPKLIYEAEDSEISGKQSTGNNIITQNSTASGEKDVENFSAAGNKLIWTVNFSEACVADIAVIMACANWDGSGNSNMTGLGQYINIYIDGVAVDLANVDLECSSSTAWNDWTAVVMKSLNMTAGEHVIIMECKTNFPNTDVLYIYSENQTVTITPVKAEEEVE